MCDETLTIDVSSCTAQGISLAQSRWFVNVLSRTRCLNKCWLWAKLLPGYNPLGRQGGLFCLSRCSVSGLQGQCRGSRLSPVCRGAAVPAACRTHRAHRAEEPLRNHQSLKMGLALWVRVGVEDAVLHFYQEITSFSCLLKACKDDTGLAEAARLLHGSPWGRCLVSRAHLTRKRLMRHTNL